MNKFIKGFQYAANGLLYSFRTQINFRVEVFSALAVLGISWYLGLERWEWLWICASIALVLITELVNTAIETLVDLVSPDFNPKAGIIKDISAGFVLISAIFALVTGLLVLLPKIIDVT